MKRYARDNGYEIIELFIEPAMAGRNQRRPEFTQIIGHRTIPSRPSSAVCGAGFTMATGKGGRYRHYRCASRTNCGARSCRCPAIRVEKLDDLVVDALAKQRFKPERLEQLLPRIMDGSDQVRERQRNELTQCGLKWSGRSLH